MKAFKINLILLLFLVQTSCNSQTKTQIDRQPAVAGQFYSSDKDELKSNLAKLFEKGIQPKGIKNVLAIISPHAGYVFSGEVSASAFNQIDADKEYENIFIIGASHYVGFDGASIYARGNFITPLGQVKVNTELANELIEKHSVFIDRIDAHTYEHSLEVQLPFLQYKMKKNFKIIPIVIGTQNLETIVQISEALKPYFNTKNLFVISTDFSHYPKYEDAIKSDENVYKAILTNSTKNLIKAIEENEKKKIPNLATSMCGLSAVLTLLYLSEKNPNIEMNLIQYKNSGDSEYGEKNRVVGYCAITASLKENNKMEKSEFKLDSKDKKDLLEVARKTIITYIKEGKIPQIETKNFSDNLKMNCGAFVTLHKYGDLRGCIGRFDASEPLYKVVQQMAIASSTEDYRFRPVSADEIDKLEIEISVLTPMKKINSIDEIELGKHGIYIKKGYRSGTFLPQVATETGWTKEEFLGHCAQDKAGIGWDGWKDAEIYIYEALVFSEKDFK